MSEINIDVEGKTCPVPLVEVRKAIKQAEEGDIITVKGTHKASRKEIPMAINAMGFEIVSNEQEGDVWTIKIKI
ncbi:MAG: sulfurtransferase TusA family protein [candidate division WOR-3 bacterium]|nr:sulfurtransferase TusA family protein [candidate division WOR-3 bacterium]